MKLRLMIYLGLICLLLMGACAPVPSVENGAEPTTAVAEDATADQPAAQEAVAAAANLTDGCVDEYDPSVDYFPEKIDLQYAEGLDIEYFNHYKLVTVLNPWSGAGQTFQYALVQCGTPIPEVDADVQVVQVPAQRIIALSTTVLPSLTDFDLLDRLVAVEEFDYVNTPAVRQKIDAGELLEVGSSPSLDMEQVINLEPDLVLTFAYGSPDYDNHPKLLEAGVPTVVTADYMETSPLGRAEWIKFIALFLNQEEAANEIFSAMAQRYEELATLAADVETRPTVFTGINRGDSWRVSGGNSYFARFLGDAGADYLWADDDSIGSVPLDFEVVYERAADADYWLPNTGRWTTLADVAAEDPRYADFAVYQTGNIYNNNGRLNEFGGNDYWETGIAHPDQILADLIAIFHPDLLPDHQPVFFLHIGADGE